MTLQQLRNVNMGRAKGYLTGSSGVGYTLLDQTGATVQFRTTSGVYEMVTGSGLYAALVTFPDQFHGSILWDTGETTPRYATEQYNVEENDPRVADNNGMLGQLTGSVGYLTGSMAISLEHIQFCRDINEGRWKLLATTNQMVFYKADNTTVIATFNLFDINGNPTIDKVAERRHA